MSAVVSAPHPRLRAMREADLHAVLAVENAAYEFPWTYGIFRDCLRVGYLCFVYETPTALIGHGVMSVAAGECHILNLCVHPDWQRRGLGAELLEFLTGVAHRRGARMALLEVRVSNRAAYRLYTRLGFDEVGVRRGYYPARGGREDAIILAREL
jgi:ribosomal-protein-alanine N-acetyltransferase